MQDAIKAAYRLAAGAVTLCAVAVQYWLIVGDKEGAAFLSSTVHFFSFFTILTNLLAGAALLWPVLGPRSDLGRFLDRASVRTAIAGYIIVVGTVYYLLLRNVSHAQGWQLVLEHLLHYLTPPLFVLDWLLFVPKGTVAWGNGLACLGFPAAYVAWTLGHGAATGWYPYYFVDVPDLGYPQTLLNIAGLVVAFLVLDLALVGIGRAMTRAGKRRRSNSSLS